MSNYIVGLDFGTHQSKVCIEDSSNRLQLTYEFLEFPGAPKGAQSTLFPSVVQINRDNTVSYGFVKPSNAMVVSKDGSNPPKKEEVREPEYQEIPAEPRYENLPPQPEPRHKGYFAILEKLLPESAEMKKWKQECATIERANENKRMAWLNRKRDVINHNEQAKEEWQRQVKAAERRYDKAYAEWREDIQRSIQMRFRYFKQATFFDRSIWTNDFISPETASIWYLAYIRFLLDKKLGKGYIVRMGVPCSYEDIDKFRQRAYNLWMSAGKLVEHYHDLAAFEKADYKELLQYGKYEHFTIDPTQPFDVRTEAQASLFAVISNRRLDTRINFLFDIGGGTTDIAVFHITSDNDLKILEAISVPKGLNYIFEAYQKDHPNKTIEQIQTQFATTVETQKNGGQFADYIETYLEDIDRAAETLSKAIMNTLLTDPWLKRGAILQALANNPSVFSGGGSTSACMRNVTIQLQGVSGIKGDLVPVFTDRRVVNKKLLGIRNVVNAAIDSVTYQILAASYGLSLSDNWYEVPSENITNTFKAEPNIPPIPKTNIQERNDEAIK